jgi:hypothetical protein
MQNLKHRLKGMALEKSSFHVMIAPLAPAMLPWGAGAHYDAPVLPEREFPADYVLWHNRDRGMPERQGQSPRKRQDYPKDFL